VGNVVTGLFVGTSVVGIALGKALGLIEGPLLGDAVMGGEVGLCEGEEDGVVVGSTLGDMVGISVVGVRLGVFEGTSLGLTLGDEKVGTSDGESVG